MNSLTFVNGATVSATDVRKSWTKIVQGIKQSHKPAFVYTNNTPEVVVISFEDYQTMQAELETARREQLGKQMVIDLAEISAIEGVQIPHMQADENGIFHQIKG